MGAEICLSIRGKIAGCPTLLTLGTAFISKERGEKIIKTYRSTIVCSQPTSLSPPRSFTILFMPTLWFRYLSNDPHPS